jgi:26S proteasome regulatory subunit N2
MFLLIKAIGIALESRRLDIIAKVFEQTKDTDLLAYAMEAALDTGFTLAYRNEVLDFLLSLFPPLCANSRHIHAFTRLLVSLSNASITIPIFASLLPGNRLVAYQLAFDLSEGGSQEFLKNVREGLPEDEVC